MRMILKCPRVVWLSLFPVCAVMALVMAPVILYSNLYGKIPDFLPWWTVDSGILAALRP